MGRTENINVFQDTMNLCKNNDRIRESVHNSAEGQKLILEEDAIVESDKNRYKEKARITVSAKRTFEAASRYKNTKTAVHNFASASNPGGGVERGANAQEECLCRCSGLFKCLNAPDAWSGFYMAHRAEHNPIHNDDIIYTPDVLVFKSDTVKPELMDEADWYTVDVITCAAPNLREKPSNAFNTGDGKDAIKITDKELLAIHKKRLRRILDVALNNKVETIVLGAFGCGAFMNNPNVVAQASKNVLNGYLYAFKNIEFAVYCLSLIHISFPDHMDRNDLCRFIVAGTFQIADIFKHLVHSIFIQVPEWIKRTLTDKIRIDIINFEYFT